MEIEVTVATDVPTLPQNEIYRNNWILKYNIEQEYINRSVKKLYIDAMIYLIRFKLVFDSGCTHL